MTLAAFQARLRALGFDPGPADAVWGPRTAAAANAALDRLSAPLEAPAVVPPAWMPPARMDRIIVHWTAGRSTANAEDRKHYHILIDGDGTLVPGVPSIALNESPVKPGYAAHTLNLNGGSIGVALCGMMGARESPFDPGPCPITPAQWAMLPKVLADLCVTYGISIIPRTVLTHAEVQGTLGVAQRGKWDIARLSFDPSLVGAKAIGDQMRRDTLAAL